MQDILIEVNVSGEESKSGVSPDEAEALVDVCETLPNVRVRGFMTMAPQGDLEIARRCFEGLAKLAEKVRASLPASSAEAFDELSYGHERRLARGGSCGRYHSSHRTGDFQRLVLGRLLPLLTCG